MLIFFDADFTGYTDSIILPQACPRGGGEITEVSEKENFVLFWLTVES